MRASLTELNFFMNLSFSGEFTGIELKHFFYNQSPVPELCCGLDKLPFNHLNFIILLVYDSLACLVFYIIHGSQSQAWTYD